MVTVVQGKVCAKNHPDRLSRLATIHQRYRRTDGRTDFLWHRPDLSVGQKTTIFLIQDGGRPPFWKSLNCHISVRNRPILMKFGTLHQILNPITVTWQKSKISKIKNGGSRHLENRFGHKSSTDCLISAKFCMIKQNGMLTRAIGQKCKCVKSKLMDGRHFENR